MMPFEKCPVCGGEVIEKEVEKLLRGGGNTATVTILAEVCLQCGERLYDQETVRCFDPSGTDLDGVMSRALISWGSPIR